jgi:hypothetical protein
MACNVTVIGFISVLIAHQESVLLLIMNNMPGSAFALARAIVEGAYRGAWLNLPATDDELKKFNQQDKIDPEFGAIAAGVRPGIWNGRLFPRIQEKSMSHSTATRMARIRLEEGGCRSAPPAPRCSPGVLLE